MERIFPVHTAGHTGVTHLSSETTFLPGDCSPADAPECYSTEEWTRVCVYWGGGGQEGVRWLVKVRGFPIFEESHFQGNERKHHHMVWNPLSNLCRRLGHATKTKPPESLTVTSHRLHWTPVCKTIRRPPGGIVYGAPDSPRGAGDEQPAGGRWVYLVVVLVPLATRSKGARSVCTTHSCVTWRGLVRVGRWVLGRWEVRWVLMSTTSHKLLLLRALSEIKTERQPAAVERSRWDAINQQFLHRRWLERINKHLLRTLVIFMLTYHIPAEIINGLLQAHK